MATGRSTPLKIGIIGVGFSGTVLALHLQRLSQVPIEIVLFEKRGCFGLGEAYSTPYPFHLLNIPAQNMSAFEDEPGHFVSWLRVNQETNVYLDPMIPISEQFVPRLLYGSYLQDLLRTLQSDLTGKLKLTCVPTEVIDVIREHDQARLILRNKKEISVDKVILALGNFSSASFPFPVSADMNCIHHTWDYTAASCIGKKDPVLIIGTGLSMIDVVLTLYHQGHQGNIYALSRHGLLPLPHADHHLPVVDMEENLSNNLLALTKHLRKQSESYVNKGGDWRSIMNAMRTHVSSLWIRASLFDKKQFIRHVLSYWNIHRHRVPSRHRDLLSQLSSQQQLTLLAGRVAEVAQGKASIKLRNKHQTMQIKVNWLINCMGPSLNMIAGQQPLLNALLCRGLATLDPLNLGFAMVPPGALKEQSGQVSTLFYTLGPPAKGVYWESNAVPEIRKQGLALARHLLDPYCHPGI